MSILHATIPPAGTQGAIDEPQWAQAHVVDAGGITFSNSSVQTTAGIALPSYFTSALSSGANNNLNPGVGWGACFELFLTSSATANVTGLLAATQGVFGIIVNGNASGGASITLNALNAGSSAANQFLSPASLTLPPGGSCFAMYDATNNYWIIH